MYSLLLDTSTEKCFVAIAKNNEVIFHAQLPPGMQSAQLLLPELQKGFDVTGLTVNDMQFICTGVGPGSYTGIRVGATVAKTLAFTAALPLIGICSLDLFVPSEAVKKFAAVIDAKIGGLYIQKGTKVDEIAIHLSPPAVYSLSEASEILQDVSTIVTPTSLRWRAKLEALAIGEWLWEENYPSPQQMLHLGLEKYNRKEYSIDGKLELLYMRKTQAEIEKEAKDDRHPRF